MGPHRLETADLTLPTGFSARGTNSNAQTRRESFAFPRQESNSRAGINAPQPLGSAQKVGRRSRTKFRTNWYYDRYTRLRSLLPLPVPSATVNGNTNAYPSANTGADASGDIHTHTYRGSSSDLYTDEYSFSATARLESNSGII